MTVKTRFAPSPTGYLHIGGLRTALYAYCFAKKNNGKFVLRIEDTDQKRYIEDALANLLRSLYWAGLVPDEGVVFDKEGRVAQKGACGGSYIQSERLPIYQKHAEELIESGRAYRCFCKPERLEKLRENQQKNKLPIGYDGHCREVDPLEAKKRASEGEKYVIRMKMPDSGETAFMDLVRGKVAMKNSLIDDQVIVKSDGFPTYHLAVVVDDHYMGITHIIRGEEWLPSVPKHLKLYEYLGWDVPQMAHLPLILNPDKSKLSKRQGDVAVEEYIKKGYLKDALINFVAFLGWNPGGERELFSLDELVQEFSLENVGKSGAVFNLEKLNWFNKEYIKKLSHKEFAEVSLPYLYEDAIIQKEISDKKYEMEFLSKGLSLEKERVAVLSELPNAVRFIFKIPDYSSAMLIWKKSSAEELKKIFPALLDFLETIKEKDWTKDRLEKTIGEWTKEHEYSNGSVLWPMRVALSGQEKSPGPFEIAGVLGRTETLNRLGSALQKI